MCTQLIKPVFRFSTILFQNLSLIIKGLNEPPPPPTPRKNPKTKTKKRWHLGWNGNDKNQVKLNSWIIIKYLFLLSKEIKTTAENVLHFACKNGDQIQITFLGNLSFTLV